MKRFPAFDPPEYLDWKADPDLLAEYRTRLLADPQRSRVLAELSHSFRLDLYRDLLRTRLHDIALKRWVRTGVISKAWLGTGEEAVTVGAVAALDRERDVVCPMIRNAGALHMMGMPMADMLKGYLATSDSPNGGRDLHLGDLDAGIVQPTSHMGMNVPVMAGIALSFRIRGEPRVALTWTGDGSVRTAAFHEGINFAAVRDLPLVVVIQNNQVALGTTASHHSPGDPATVPAAYGIPSWTCDGNNVLDVHVAARLAVERCRQGEGPAMVVAETFRMGGHATHDEREARDTFPPETFESWGRRDPIGLFEAFLMEDGTSTEELARVEEEVVAEVEAASEEALAARGRTPEPRAALFDGFSQGGPLVGLDTRPI
jgi:TPP-dependent pyruvate/acetoin dehydrogenase alpha subunit